MEKPVAWIVDIDGTLALGSHRDPYNWQLADRDLPNRAVVTAVQALDAHPQVSAIVAVSGRHEAARSITAEWLHKHQVPVSDLLMRRDGDYRPDETVKEEIYLHAIAPRYNVLGVIDDRERVVKMWRRLGLVCFQVAEGLF